MKLFTLILIIFPFAALSQWQTLDGPNTNPQCEGVFQLNGHLILSGYCATFASSNAGAGAMLRASNDTDAFIEADAEM